MSKEASIRKWERFYKVQHATKGEQQMSDVVGERKFTTAGREVAKPERTPPPPGDYVGKLMGTKAEVRQGTEQDSLPYVTVPAELLDSAPKEGAKNRWQYINFWLSLLPSPKDGKINADRSNGLTAFGKSIGETIDLGDDSVMDFTTRAGKVVPIINPHKLVKYLREKDGVTFKMRVKLEKDKQGERSTVDRFIEAEAGADPFGAPTDPVFASNGVA